MLPGVSSAATASPRNSTVNGLPSTAYNITIDGLNTQDNLNKNTDELAQRHDTLQRETAEFETQLVQIDDWRAKLADEAERLDAQKKEQDQQNRQRVAAHDDRVRHL